MTIQKNTSEKKNQKKKKTLDPRKLTDQLMKLQPVTPDINNCSTAVIRVKKGLWDTYFYLSLIS